MFLNYKFFRKRNLLLLIFFLIISSESCVLFSDVLAVDYQSANPSQKVSGNSIKRRLRPNESRTFQFSNNKILGISTDVFMDLSIEYQNEISNREAFFIVNNSDSIVLDVKAKVNIKDFGFLESTKEPNYINSDWEYDCIYQIKSNVKVEKLTLQFFKNSQYGLDPSKSYLIAIIKPNQDTWEILYTIESSQVPLQITPKVEISSDSSSEIYLEGLLTNLEANQEYYVTIYEVKSLSNIWFFWIVIIIIGVVSIVIVLSKTEYIHYLKTRITPIEKGVHRLSLENVLENENRNQIIDFILKEPGIHFNELLRKTNLAAGNLVWHLDILETYKIIGKKRIGNFVAYFPYYDKNPVSNIDLKLRKSKLTLEVLKIIERKPGIWNSVISKQLKVDHKTIQYHVNKLMDLNLINVRKEGRKKKLFPNFDSKYYSKKNQN